MKKECYRDYATDAFRLWAALKKTTYEEFVRGIENENEAGESVATLYDILACEITWERLKNRNELICKAVEEVYMCEPKRPIRSHEIGARVRRFAFEQSVCERQVWNWLAEARKEFAKNRGLRVDSIYAFKKC